MKNRINWIKVLIFTFLIGTVIWAGKGIFKYNVFSTHDLDHHLARAFDVVQTIKEGNFPLRWAGSLNYFCGVPIYNFFYPLIYYLFAGISFFTKDIIFTLKLIDFLSLLFGTIFFYFWIRVETKKELPAIGGALTYLYAPYRFSLIFVRGSPEFLAYAILPIVLYFYAKLFDSTGTKFFVYAFLASFFGAVLTISHNFTVMFLMPIILAFLIIKIYVNKFDIKKILWIAFSFLGSFGMGSFFIGPALFEKKFTKIGQTFLEWRDHFPTLAQLWKSKWNYFYSAPGTFNDGMSFMLGYAQWLILGIAIIFIIYQLFKSKFKFSKFINENIFIIFFFVLSILTIYLILPWSIPVWEKIKPLQEIQFSWRLLGIAVFTISSLFAFLLAKINSKLIYLCIFVFVSLLTIVGTRNFMLPQPVSVEDLYRYDDFNKLHYHRYSTTTLGDDVTAPSAAGACWFDVPLIATEKEEVKFDIVERGNTFGFVKFSIPNNPLGKTLTTGLGYFPGIYKFDLNGKEISYNDCGGRVCFAVKDLREGQNYISWKIVQSPIENAFNYLTLGFFALWAVILFINLTGIYKDKKNLRLFVSAILIFFLFIFFRSYNLLGRVGFGWDQERDATTALNIINGELTLLGPRVQGPSAFFLPPYFFYLLTPFYKLAGLSPIASAIFIIVYATIFFKVSFIAVSKMFDRQVALTFLALWAVNPLAISIDTIAWNPILIPLIFILLIYLIYLYFETKKTKLIFLMGIMFGLGISFHLQFLFIFPLLIPLLIEIVKGKRFKNIIHLLGGMVLPFAPIVLFDLRHNFLNIKQIAEFVKNGGEGINRVWIVWERASSFMVGGSPSKFLGAVIYLLVLFGFINIIKNIKEEVQRKIFIGMAYVWGFSLPLFYIFIKNPSEYYFNYLLIPLLIFVAYKLKNNWRLGVAAIAVVISYFIIQSKPLLNDIPLSLREKDRAVVALGNITKNAGPFNVSYDVPFNEDSGFRYLLNYHKIMPSGSSTDPLVEFVMPHQKKPTAFVSGQIGIYFPPTWLVDNWLKQPK